MRLKKNDTLYHENILLNTLCVVFPEFASSQIKALKNSNYKKITSCYCALCGIKITLMAECCLFHYCETRAPVYFQLSFNFEIAQNEDARHCPVKSLFTSKFLGRESLRVKIIKIMQKYVDSTIPKVKCKIKGPQSTFSNYSHSLCNKLYSIITQKCRLTIIR